MYKSVVINKVEDVGSIYGVATRHPEIAVINYDNVKYPSREYMVNNIYTICCLVDEDGSGEVRFYSPGNTITIDPSRELSGLILCFHPDILNDTLLAHRMPEYAFFNFAPHDSIRLDRREMMIVKGCIMGIDKELCEPIDRHTKRIIVSGIAVLLSYCLRFYDLQHSIDKDHSNMIKRLNMLLNSHLSRPINERCKLPTVAWCAEQLHLSANYFGDLVRHQANRSAQDIIHQRIVAEARILLDRGKYSISEISYHLGFKYPHHLSRVFKRLTGITPNEYRQQHIKK